MKLKKFLLNLCLLLLFLFLLDAMILSCATKPKFSGNADLCGLVVDENNRPVKGFVIRAFCGISGIKSALTNENGIFVIENVPSGKIVISGEKKNYLKLSDANYQFINRSDIFCCQVKSVKAVINLVDELLMRDENQLALDLLDNVSCEKKSMEWRVVQSYKFFLTESKHKKKEILSSFKQTVGLEEAERQAFLSEYAKSLEVFIK